MGEAKIYQKALKRPFDLLCSSVSLIFLSPLMIILALLIKIRLGSPILFKQKRPGKNGKIFTIFKFRTMTNKKDSFGNYLSDGKRLTKFGEFLRSSSLDELPGLINILFGNMSIVGPRPLLIEYLPLHDKKQRLRHNVKPGLTGLAQISGRNTITWEKKFELDLLYVENITFLGDLKIVLSTAIKVIVRHGINSKTFVTMERFEGNIKQSDRS